MLTVGQKVVYTVHNTVKTGKILAITNDICLIETASQEVVEITKDQILEAI